MCVYHLPLRYDHIDHVTSRGAVAHHFQRWRFGRPRRDAGAWPWEMGVKWTL